MSFEIHPRTPVNGVPLTNLFSEAAIQNMFERLQNLGNQYGIEFNPYSHLPNARMALKASEFAKEKGRFHEFHEAVFYAYFTAGKDIGDLNEILHVAEASGLNLEELEMALNEKKYISKLFEAREEGRKYGINVTPTVIIDDRYKIVGVQPIEVFRELLTKILVQGNK